LDRPDNHKDIASVRRQAAEGGLRFEAYLPPGLAEWVISLVEQEVFHSPAEAVFVAMQSFRELDDHPDLNQELLNRVLQKRIESQQFPPMAPIFYVTMMSEQSADDLTSI
jgi:antitoxin ParD1/3/4